MAYNNGFPMGYQQMYYQPQYQPQQMQYQSQQAQQMQQVQPMQQAQMPGTNQPSIIWVQNELEATNYPVAPNAAVTLWSTSEPVVYLKQADATGKPTLKTYDLVERAPAPPKAVPVACKETVEYATKSDLVAVAGVVKGFDELIGGLKSDIETMKGDLYGVAGRKKTASRKPKEETEEDE